MWKIIVPRLKVVKCSEPFLKRVSLGQYSPKWIDTLLTRLKEKEEKKSLTLNLFKWAGQKYAEQISHVRFGADWFFL